MTNPKLGDKHICKDCNARFFDMKKRPATCPKCGLKVTPAKATKVKRSTPVAAQVVKPDIAKEPTPADAVDGSDVDLDKIIATADIEPDKKNLDDDEDEDGLIEDASDLGEDEDDLSEVREHMDDEVVDKS